MFFRSNFPQQPRKTSPIHLRPLPRKGIIQSANRKSANCYICGRSENLKNECKFADLRFAELICKPPSFAFATIIERNADVFRCVFTVYNKVQKEDVFLCSSLVTKFLPDCAMQINIFQERRFQMSFFPFSFSGRSRYITLQCWNFRTTYGGQAPSRNWVVVSARQATQASGIDSMESIPGLLKSLKIPSQTPNL